MKTIIRRISALEMQLAPQVDEWERSMAEAIRESRRRHLAAEGLEFKEEPRGILVDAEGNQPRTLAEMLRAARFAQRERELAEARERAR